MRFPLGSTSWALIVLKGGNIAKTAKSSSMQCMPRSFHAITVQPALGSISSGAGVKAEQTEDTASSNDIMVRRGAYFGVVIMV